MTDAEYQVIQEKCQGFIGTWKDRLWLQHWDIQPMYYREPSTDNTLMSVTPDWRYLQAEVHVHAWDVHAQQLGDVEIERCVIHELCHCLVEEMSTAVPGDRKEWHQNHVERTVSTLTNVLYAAYQETP